MRWRKKKAGPQKVFGVQPWQDRFKSLMYWKKPRVRVYAIIERKGNVYPITLDIDNIRRRQAALMGLSDPAGYARMQMAQMAHGQAGLGCQSALAGLGFQGI